MMCVKKDEKKRQYTGKGNCDMPLKVVSPAANPKKVQIKPRPESSYRKRTTTADGLPLENPQMELMDEFSKSTPIK